MSTQLNKLQIKAEILTVLSKLQSMPDAATVENIVSVLMEQEDKRAILDVLIKELLRANEQKTFLICFLLVKLCVKEELEEELWGILKNRSVSDTTKSIVLSLLKEMGNKVDYEKFNEYFESPEAVIDADTQKLLHVAIVNPEAQIDFLDFLHSLPQHDKKVLIESLGEDYSSDDLANILNPVFLYSPTSELGKIALAILGETKSQLALHTLNKALEFVKDEDTVSSIKKNISKLKIAGVREDKAIDFYKDVLSATRPYKSFTSYPDGHGNMALIFSRLRPAECESYTCIDPLDDISEDDTLQIVAIVVNDTWGIVDCFGFNQVSRHEFERIVDRFYDNDERVFINHSVLKNILKQAEDLTRKTEGEISYEYVCWKTLLYDIESEPVPVDMIMSTKYSKEALKSDDLVKIYGFDFIQRWFMDTDSNSLFKSLMEELNASIQNDDYEFDLEQIVVKNAPLIFADEQKKLLDKRILLSAYLKYLSGENDSASLLYSLYYDEDNKAKLMENILRKSVYEYYVSLKFKLKEEKTTTNIFSLKNKQKSVTLSEKQINLMISLIEALWVQE